MWLKNIAFLFNRILIIHFEIEIHELSYKDLNLTYVLLIWFKPTTKNISVRYAKVFTHPDPSFKFVPFLLFKKSSIPLYIQPMIIYFINLYLFKRERESERER